MQLNKDATIIVADMAEATYVNYGLEELRAFIGIRSDIVTAWNSDSMEPYQTIIAVGSKTLTEAGLPNEVTATSPGAEGYIISVHSWKDKKIIAIAGSDPQGTKYALMDLIRSVSQQEGKQVLPDDFHRFEKPHFRIRAMYGHLHWQYNYPYASRSWGLEDWKNYIDILSYFGCNTLQIWPMLCIMPDPLSPEDERYLSTFADVVDYAHKCRGMLIWVGECCNNVASTDWGTPIQRREYFGTEKLLNPGDPRDIEELMSSRSNLYRCIPNADAYWIIDSDPGSWKGSVSSEYVDIFARNQALMKQYNDHGAAMNYWMFWGWGTGSREENWENVLLGLKERLDEPWNILMHPFPGAMEVVTKVGLLHKVIYYPYGTIEPEPGTPLTLFNFDSIREHIEFALNNGLNGYMAQAQTPILQLPSLYYVFRCLWNPENREKDPLVLLQELASMIDARLPESLALSWAGLMSGDLEKLQQARDGLEKVQSRSGVLGRFLFGNPDLIAEDVLAHLRIKENGERFSKSVSAERPLGEIRDYFYHYIHAALVWHSRHQYHAMGGNKYLYGAYLEPGAEGWHSYIDRYDRSTADFDIHWPTKSRLIQEGEFHPALIDNVILEVISQPRN